MKISVFGLGYVGCVSIGCLSENGFELIGVDINLEKVALINTGKPTIIEEGITGLLKTNFEKGRISATSDVINAIKNTKISIICVGTPSSDNGQLDVSNVYSCAENIAEGIKQKNSYHLVIIRSTVVPGTNTEVKKIIERISEKKNNLDFSVVSNPEFLREGTAIHDYLNPDIIVIGSDNSKAIDLTKSIYSMIKAKICITNIKTAEIIKYANNSFHALKISFANEIGLICKKLNIDSHEVMKLFCEDKKLNLSSYYLKPGYAYGGSCLPKDLKGLNMLAYDNYLKTPLLNAIEKSNENIKNIALSLIMKENKKNIGIVGLSFKKGTDDLRQSPAVELCESLIGKGYNVKIYDKNISLSKLTGANKSYIDTHIPHLSKLITDNFKELINFSEIIVITQKLKILDDINLEIENKKIIDLIRISDKSNTPNYEGICW